MKAEYTRVGLAMALVGCVATASASEPSATLRQFQGRVFVGQASAIKPASEGMRLYSGDRVVAVAGGGAQVVYASGCTVVLPESSILTIEGAAQCRAGQAAVRTTAGFQKQVIGQTLAPSQAAGGTGGAGLTIGGLTLTATQVAAVLGGTAVVALVAVGASQSNDSDIYFTTEDQSASR